MLFKLCELRKESIRWSLILLVKKWAFFLKQVKKMNFLTFFYLLINVNKLIIKLRSNMFEIKRV